MAQCRSTWASVQGGARHQICGEVQNKLSMFRLAPFTTGSSLDSSQFINTSQRLFFGCIIKLQSQHNSSRIAQFNIPIYGP
jgi:hypothetical protein